MLGRIHAHSLKKARTVLWNEKKRPSRQVSFSFCEDFRNATGTFRLTLLSYTVSITAKYYISAKIKGQIIYKEKNPENINVFSRFTQSSH